MTPPRSAANTAKVLTRARPAKVTVGPVPADRLDDRIAAAVRGQECAALHAKPAAVRDNLNFLPNGFLRCPKEALSIRHASAFHRDSLPQVHVGPPRPGGDDDPWSQP